MIVRSIVCIVVVLTTGLQVFAQETLPDTLVLEGVNVFSSRLKDYGAANKVVSIKNKSVDFNHQTTLSELLTQYSGLTIRSYGVAGLSTVSFRGAGSSQSAIMWEGFNLQSPMNGTADLNAIPVSFIDDVSLQYGAGSSLFGGGAIGGSVQLNSETAQFIDNPFGVSLHQQAGSFGKWYTGLNLSSSGDKYAVKVRGFIQDAENDFSFHNRFSQQEEKMANAGANRKGLLFEPSVKLNDKSDISLKYWVQDNEVEIPKTAGQGTETDDIQKDRFHRAALTYNRETGGKGKIKARTAWLNHKLTYNQNIPSTSNSWISEIQTDHLLNQVRLQVGAKHIFETAEVSSYGGLEPTRNQTALFLLAKKVFLERVEVSASAREVLVDGETTPFVPSVGVNYMAFPWYSIKAKVARSFRMPTFNDLYWSSGTDGGNPDLKPEKGLNIELGHVLTLRDNLSAELTVYSNYIDNWIQWQPNSSGNWRPVNVLEAWLRGVEFSGDYSHRLSSIIKVYANVQYSYTKATNEKIESTGNPSELGKELIYVPNHTAAANVSVSYKKLKLAINQTFTGEQFTTSDNSQRWVLDSYTLTAVGLSYIKSLSNHVFDISVRVNNVFDKEYEVRSSYPMPGRNYNLSLKYTFN